MAWNVSLPEQDGGDLVVARTRLVVAAYPRRRWTEI